MTLHLTNIPKLLVQRSGSALMGMIIIAMLWGAVAISYTSDVKQDYRDIERRNQNYAMIFEENVLRSIGEIDKALLYLRKSVEDAKGHVDYQTIVNSTAVLSEIIVQVAIIDANGISRASNAVQAPPGIIDISDREHFRVHVNSTEDKLFISKPLIGRASGKWSVQLTRRFLDQDGHFAGIVVASMNPAHFTSFYEKIDLGPATVITMVGDDGIVRSSGGGEAVPRMPLGADITGTRLFEFMRAGADGAFDDPGASPETSMFVTARNVRGYPLWVVVSTKESAIYSPSSASLNLKVGVAALLTLLVLIALERILRAEARAKQKTEHLQLTLDHISQGIMLVTNERQIPIINERCGEILRLPKRMIESPPSLDELVQEEVPADVMSRWTPASDQKAAMAKEPQIFDFERDDGLFIEARKTMLPGGGSVQTFTDITTRREAEACIARMATEDPLTGLANRRLFQSKLEDLCGRWRAYEPGQPRAEFAVLFLDLDRFKVVNDTLGHRIGDLLLVEVAKRLVSELSATDILARLGGDEFAILVPAAKSVRAVERMADGIVQAMTQPFQVDCHFVRSSVSIGIAMAPRDGKTADDLLVAADLALYAVKMERRGIYRFYERSMNDDVNDRRQVEIDLREGIEQGQLELHYQPIVDLRQDFITGFEALARWRHPQHGMISPAKFIPVAEDCGLILQLGEWALAEACRAAAQWPDDLKIAVNLSPVQIASPDLPNRIAVILAETGLKASRLTLEITERTFLDETPATLTTLHQLKQLGIGIALDDFGTGYSSLSYLRSFPFDTLKIDRSFVSDLGRDSGGDVIVQAVILIANGLGIKTVAEGVETPLQQQFLKTLGCDAAQGYLLSVPIPVAEVSRLIDQWSGARAPRLRLV
jgi:diguanylate cyclase (GGDEF)-like protein